MKASSTSSWIRRPLAAVLALSILCAAGLSPMPAAARGGSDPSEISVISGFVMSVVPAMALSGAAELSVVAVKRTAQGVEWVLQRASDGVQFSVQVSGNALGQSGLAVGTMVSVVVTSTGWILTQSGQVLCFIANESGAALLHHEQVTR